VSDAPTKGRIEIGADVPECTACGTCCFSTLPEYIRVFGFDHDRMDDAARAYTHFLGNRCYMRLEDGHCAALRVELAPSHPLAGRFTCAIYEVRPDACRSLERGSGGCKGERHEKAERPLIALDRLVRRAAEDGGAEPAPTSSARR
jgi:Fe-S-cluster containining protein